jgi:hypothetical protein
MRFVVISALAVASFLPVLAAAPAMASPARFSDCHEPQTSIPVEQKAVVEGTVSAGIAAFKADATGSSDRAQTWIAQLPSQSAVDFQWKEYALCLDLEAGRVSPDMYCAMKSALFEKANGATLPPGMCAPGVTASVAGAEGSTQANGSPLRRLDRVEASYRSDAFGIVWKAETGSAEVVGWGKKDPFVEVAPDGTLTKGYGSPSTGGIGVPLSTGPDGGTTMNGTAVAAGQVRFKSFVGEVQMLRTGQPPAVLHTAGEGEVEDFVLRAVQLPSGVLLTFGADPTGRYVRWVSSYRIQPGA